MGKILITAGACLVAYYYFFFDVSVAIPGGSQFGIARVNNIGLMQDRQNGIIIGFGCIIVGLLINYLGSGRPEQIQPRTGGVGETRNPTDRADELRKERLAKDYRWPSDE